MEFKEILRRRRSVRKYLSRPVEREVLDTVLREALAAPSSRNSHSTHLRVVTDPETFARIARMRDYGSAFLEHAPAVVLVEGDRTATDLWRENAAITATALLFAATDAGLASCWVDGMPFIDSVRFAQGCSSMALACEYTNNPELSIANVTSLVENTECLN